MQKHNVCLRKLGWAWLYLAGGGVNFDSSLTLKVDLNLRFSLKLTKVYYNRFSHFEVDLNLRKYLNI